MRPFKPARGSLKIEVERPKNTNDFEITFACRGCGSVVVLKNKSLTDFYYECESCGFIEEVKL
jgi:predicted RNA-binding Zn-ribbon protein involved in translation (DUF1610 family)